MSMLDRVDYTVRIDGGVNGTVNRIAAGQQLEANSLPVVLPAAQVAAIGAAIAAGIPPVPWVGFQNEGAPIATHEVVAAPGVGLRLVVTDIVVSVDPDGANGTIFFMEATGAPVARSGIFYVVAGVGLHLPFATPMRLSANVNFGFTSTGFINHSVTVLGYTE